MGSRLSCPLLSTHPRPQGVVSSSPQHLLVVLRLLLVAPPLLALLVVLEVPVLLLLLRQGACHPGFNRPLPGLPATWRTAAPLHQWGPPGGPMVDNLSRSQGPTAAQMQLLKQHAPLPAGVSAAQTSSCQLAAV